MLLTTSPQATVIYKTLLACTAPGGQSLSPQDKGSLGKKQKLPVFVVTATPAVSKSMERLGKKQKLPVFVVTATPAVSKSMERFGKKQKLPGLVVSATAAGKIRAERLGKKKSFPIMWW